MFLHILIILKILELPKIDIKKNKYFLLKNLNCKIIKKKQ